MRTVPPRETAAEPCWGQPISVLRNLLSNRASSFLRWLAASPYLVRLHAQRSPRLYPATRHMRSGSGLSGIVFAERETVTGLVVNSQGHVIEKFPFRIHTVRTDQEHGSRAVTGLSKTVG